MQTYFSLGSAMAGYTIADGVCVIKLVGVTTPEDLTLIHRHMTLALAGKGDIVVLDLRGCALVGDASMAMAAASRAIAGARATGPSVFVVQWGSLTHRLLRAHNSVAASMGVTRNIFPAHRFDDAVAWAREESYITQRALRFDMMPVNWLFRQPPLSHGAFARAYAKAKAAALVDVDGRPLKR